MPAVQTAMVGGWRRQHTFFPPGGEWASAPNHIRLLRIGDRIHSDQTSVGHALANHFWEFYRRGPLNEWKWAPTVPTINLAQQQHLIRPFSDEEVEAVVWGLNSEGALGPDGILLIFYKECWDVIGLEVMSVMEEFHTSRC